MYKVYILYSVLIDKYYIGHTDNIEKRLNFHLTGESPYTSRAKDWQLKHTENYLTKSEAMKRENAIKRKKSRKYIEWLINGVES